MTANKRDKIRGALLAALMVASVFAVATPAAAGVSSADRTTATSIGTGQTTTVTVSTTMDGSGGSFSLSEAFSGAVASASVQNVSVNGGPANTVIAQADSNGATVVLSGSAPANAQIDVTYEITAASSPGSITVQGNVTSTGGETDLGSDSITVSASSTNFQVSGLSAPSSAVIGNTITASATIENTGTASGTETVSFNLAGSTVATQQVTLNPGETTTVSFDLDTTGQSPGTYTHGISTPSDSESASITLNDAPNPLRDDADAPVRSGGGFWAGQDLFFEAASGNANDVYTLHRVQNNNDDQFITDVELDANGSAIISTSSNLITTGEYVIFDQGGDPVEVDSDGVQTGTSTISDASFSIRTQNFSPAPSLENSEVTQGDSTDLTIQSNRANYDVNISTDDAEIDDWSEVVPSADSQGVFSASTDTTVELDTSELDGGSTYDFDLEVVDSTASGSVSLTVNSPAPEDISFGFSGNPSVTRGSVLELPINVQGTDEARLRIGSDDVGYNVSATLNDGSDDGTVTLRLNTFQTSVSAASTLSVVNSSDSVSQITVNGDLPDSPIAATSYELRLIDPGTDDIVEDGVSSFIVRNREPGLDLQTWTSPEGTTFDNRTDIVNQVGSTVTPDDSIAFDDVLIHQVSIPSFEGVIEANEGSTDADTLDNLVGDELDLTVEQTNPDPNRDAKSLDLSSSSSGVSLHYNASNDELYVVMDTTDLVFERNGSPVNADAGDEFNATIQVTDEDIGGEDESASAVFELVEREVSLDAPEDVRLNAAPGQTLTGETSLAPGTEYNIQLSGPNLFEIEDVTTQPDGTFNVSFNLSGQNVGDELTASLSGNGLSASQTYTVQDAPAASVSISDQTSSDGRFITVDSASLESGGFIAIHQGDAGGPVIGFSSYLAPGNYSNVAVQLNSSMALSGGSTTLVAMPHLDDNNNQEYDFPDADAPYVSDGAPVTDSASVTVPTTTTTTTSTTTTTTTTESTTTSTPTTTTTTESTTTESTTESTEEPTTTEGDGPGFTVVLALIALVAASLLAVRRRDN